MTERSKFEVGQEVRLFPSLNSRRFSDCPIDGWPAAISSVGRKYVTVKRIGYGDDFLANNKKFEIENGLEKTNYPGDAYRIKTLEQVAQDVQRQADENTLATHGVKLDWASRPSIEVLHIMAEALRSHFGEKP